MTALLWSMLTYRCAHDLTVPDLRYSSMKLGLSICAVLGIDPLVLVFGSDFKTLDPDYEDYLPDATERTLLG